MTIDVTDWLQIVLVGVDYVCNSLQVIMYDRYILIGQFIRLSNCRVAQQTTDQSDNASLNPQIGRSDFRAVINDCISGWKCVNTSTFSGVYFLNYLSVRDSTNDRVFGGGEQR